MKLNKLVLPLVLALTSVLATTGCKHGFNGQTTTLFGHRPAPVPDDHGGTTIPSPQPPPVNTPPPIFTQTPVKEQTFIPTAEFDLTNYTQDHLVLAAYTVHFKFDSAVVPDSEQANLASVGQSLADPNLRLLIEGNCDERGTEEYNRSLGERRALALREALQKIGVDPMHVKTISYGKDKPADEAHNEAAWKKNRRGDFVLLRPKPPVQ